MEVHEIRVEMLHYTPGTLRRLGVGVRPVAVGAQHGRVPRGVVPRRRAPAGGAAAGRAPPRTPRTSRAHPAPAAPAPHLQDAQAATEARCVRITTDYFYVF